MYSQWYKAMVSENYSDEDFHCMVFVFVFIIKFFRECKTLWWIAGKKYWT